MKHLSLIKLFLTTVVTVLSFSMAMAESVVIDDIRYRLNTEDKTAAVEESWNPTFLEGDIVIPSKIKYNDEEYVVTEFDERAFYGCTEMETISIPNTITKIGDKCFRSCQKLKHVTLPSSIKEVGNQCFRECYELESAVLPDNLEKIGSSMFYHCESLTDVHLPMNLVTIPQSCFEMCKRLREITIPDKVESVENQAFWYCERLSKVIIPPSVKTWAATINLPYGVRLEIYISDFDAFCKYERNIASNTPYWLYLNDEMVTNVVIPEDSEATFYYCASMKSIKLPDSAKECYFSDYAESLEEVTVSPSAESIKLFLTTINTINCYATTPPPLIMYDDCYKSVTAHVPVGTKEQYAQAEGWNKVGTIIDDLNEDSGVNDVVFDTENADPEFYNLNGVHIGSNLLTPGLYIKRIGNKSEKILVK